MAFPTTLDTITPISGCTDSRTLQTLTNEIITLMEAVETKVGVDSSAVVTTLDYKLANAASIDPGHEHTLATGARNVTASAAELNQLDGVTPGTVSNSKAVVADASRNIDFGSGTLTINNIDGAIALSTNTIDSSNKILDASGTNTFSGTAISASNLIIDEETYSSDWVTAGETWTYVSATTYTVTGDLTGKYNKGDKIRLKQGGAYKYFYIVNVAHAAGITTVTVFAGSDYTLVSATITDNYYTKLESPNGFPTTFNYTRATNGFSSITDSSTKFFIIGNVIFMVTYILGVSNDTVFTFDAPLANGGSQVVQPVSVLDNGTGQSGYLVLNNASSTVAVYRYVVSGSNVMAGGVWTNTGNKLVYPLAVAYNY